MGAEGQPTAVDLPVGLVETSAAPEPGFPRALEAGLRAAALAAPGELRRAGYPPAPAATPPGPPRFTRVVFAESETAAGEPHGAGNPLVPAATPPGPPRFIRVVFAESETAALRRLLSQAPDQPTISPVPVEARTPAVGEPPAELVIPLIAIEPRAEVIIPPITIEPPLTIEPLNVALLDTDADQ